MTDRANKQFNSVFGDTLWVENNGQGLDFTLRPIQDGLGNPTILTISQIAFNIDTSGGGSFTINGDPYVDFSQVSVVTVSANADLPNERLLTPGTNINILDGGAGGNITVSLIDNPTLTGTQGVTPPTGTIAERPGVPNLFELRGNTDLNDLEVWDGVDWINILTGGSGAPINATYITQIPNGLLTSAQALSTLPSGFLMSTTTTGVVNSRVFTGTASQITVTNGDGNAGNPTFSLPADVIISNSLTVDGLLINDDGLNNTTLDSSIFLTTNNLGTVVLSNFTNGGALEFENAAGTFSSGFRAGNNTSDVIWILPTTDSTGTQCLVSNGAEVLSWQSFLPISGGTLTGNLILNADPTTSLQAATKHYVDSVSSGLTVKTPAFAGTTANLNATYANGTAGVGATLTNAGAQAAFSVDGVSPASTSRILVKNQTSSFQNGVYTLTTVGTGATNWVLTRATDYNTPGQIAPGTFIIVNNGTANSNTGWIETATVVTIGTDPITFSQFGNPGTVTSVTGTAGQIDVANSTSTPVISIDNAYVGQTSITTLGTVSTGTWSATNIALNKGGTNAALVASNGGIFYSTATAGAILAGTATATQVLLSGSSTTPTWSTATYPATTTANQILYSSATNTIGGLTSAANGVLVTDGSSVPSISATLPTAVQGNITSTGTITTGVWHGTNIALNKGGTNAALVASNGGIFYSTASAGAILAGTATANQILMSGASTTPAWSTATYPATTTVSQILYSSSANVVGGITTANNGMLVTGNTGVPSISALTAGQVFIGTTSAAPTAATLTAGTGVSITSASGSITIASTVPGGNWVDQTSTSVTMAVNTSYIADSASLVTLTLPSTAALGSVFQIVGKGAGGWQVAQAASQQIAFGNVSTTSGVGGSLASTNSNDCVLLVCVTANTNFVVFSPVGNLTVV